MGGNRRTKIDWHFWLSFSELKAGQACALSLDIDPDSMAPGYGRYTRGPGSSTPWEGESRVYREVMQEFDKRLRLLTAAMRDRSKFPLDVRNLGYEGDWFVPLSAFAKWMVATGRQPLVPELRELAAQSGTDAPTAPEAKASRESPPASAAAAKHRNSDWREAARSIADEFFDHDTRLNTRDSLENYARRVMVEMQKRELHGPRGRIDNHKTVMREALQGSHWWKAKAK